MTGLIVAMSGGKSALAQNAQLSASMRRMVGSGLLVAVGYIDPGNWATDIAGGSGFGYGLLSVVIASALLALGFQVLVSRLALATGQDLATLTARHLSPHGQGRLAGRRGRHSRDRAGRAGRRRHRAAPAVRPALLGGVAVTGVGTFAVLALTRGNADRHERVIAVLLAIVAASFVFLLFKANPAWIEVAQGVARTGGALRDPQGFLIALGILGATLMPHNLYLHSGSLAERARSLPADARDIAMRVARNDTALSLGVAMLINAAIMIVAAASLSGPGLIVSSLDDAHAAIGHTLGAGAAIIFAVALYAAGQSSTITGVLAGRIPSRGFQAGSNWSDRRRALATRLIAGAAAAGLLGYSGGQDPDGLLVLSQVILSLALPFALAPLVLLACRKSIMGRHALRGAWAWAAIAATVGIIALDGYLLADTLL